MTAHKTPESLSLCRISLDIPTTWKDLTQKQLRYFFSLSADHCSRETILLKCISRFTGLRYMGAGFFRSSRQTFILTLDQMTALRESMSWITELPKHPVRLHRIGGRAAIDPLFMGVPFEEYLKAENLFQQMISNDEIVSSSVGAFFRLLYPRRWHHRFYVPDDAEVVSMICWWSSLKQFFAGHFNELFVSTGESSGPVDMEEVMNRQIRTLTGGDVTKEHSILAMDTWRALTELNEKAREARLTDEKLREYGSGNSKI